ncbi:MAG TPA: carboxypeptidase-like regulatory domain-containing protein [Puia sp.]|jgi:hypothetical protein
MIPIIRPASLLLVCILFLSTGRTQEIRGRVKDSTGSAVPYASVNLRNRSLDVLVAYTTTDTSGAYVLRLPTGAPMGDLYLEVRCIGYKNQSRAITGLSPKIDFTLAISDNQLQSVVVRSRRPMLHSNGDTLSYKVSDFSAAQDRVIGDVIKKLPGISIASDGTISYNNRPISAIYIGGDNLLDDKYSIATNTIPHGVVENVQVIENHQPIRVLQNKVTSNDVAINLVFKKSDKLHLLGQESIGAGLPGNYDVDFNAMAFKAQFKAINYLKGNNTGDDLQRELVSHNSAVSQQRTGNDPPATLLSLGSVNNPALSRERYFFDRSGLMNINNLVNLKNGLQLRVNAYYLHDQQRQDYSQRTSIYLAGDTVQYTETQHNRFNPDLLHALFTLNANNDKYYLNNTLVLDDSRWANYSELNTNGTLANQVFRDRSRSFSNEFDWIRAMRSRNIIEAYSYTSHLAEPESRTIGTNYNAELFNKGIPYAQLVQNVNVPTWFTNNYVSFKIPGGIVTQSFRTGFSVQSQMLTSALNVLQSNNTVSLESDSAVNDVKWSKRKLYAEAAYDIPGDRLKANLTLPVTFSRLNYSDPGYSLNKELTRWYFNPQLNVRYKTGIEKFVILSYSYRNETGSIQDIYQGSILKDYRTLYSNSSDLTLRQNQLAAVGFYYRKLLTLFFFSINAMYNHIDANNIASSVISNNFQQGIVLPYPNSTDTWTANGSISKYSFPLHTTFSGVVQWQDGRSVQIQNGTLLPFHTTTATLSGGADTKLNEQLNFSYRVTGIQTESHSPATGSANHIDQLVQQGSIYYNPGADLQFKLSGEHYFTRPQGNADLKYFFADASVKYRVNKWRTDLQLEATNFLNVKTYDALYLSAGTFVASSYTLPGSIILLKVLFNL